MLTVFTGYQQTAYGAPEYLSSFLSNLAADPYQSSYALASRNPSGFETAQYASLRQQDLSAPPDATAYMQPTWVAAISAPSQQSSRPTSSMGMSRPNVPFTYSPASTLGRNPSECGCRGLPDRPSEWRRDFSIRSGLVDQNDRCCMVAVSPSYHSVLRSCNDCISSVLDHISYSRSTLPFLRFHVLQFPPLTLPFRNVPHQIVSSASHANPHSPSCISSTHVSHRCRPRGRLPSYLDISSDTDPAN